MNRFIRLAMMSASGLAMSAGAALADYELSILHINDFHSRIESINKYDSTCSAEEETKNECFGGAARLKTAIDQTRASLSGKNVLLLNAGDNFQGSLFYTTYKGAVEAEFLNLMKFDAMTVGNHEFDDSEDGLKIFLDKVQFPVVTANVLASFKSVIKDKIVPSLVLDVGGQKIGIVGAVANDTEQLASPGPNIMIGVDDKAIADEVQKLKAQGINKIIALTHVGYPRDLAVIAKIADVDIVVGGHSHTLLSNTDKTAGGPYPTLVDNPGGYKVPVVQAGSYSKYLGDLDVVFDDNGVVKTAKGDPILIDATFKPDAAISARIKELGAPIEALKAKIIGASSAPIDGSRETCRAKECEMGNLVADAMLDRVKDQGIQIAFANGGGLRASIDGGDVSMGEVLTVLPFQNSLATFQLKGTDVVAALESGVSQVEEGKGRFPQVAGLKYSFDPSKPAGSRVVSVEVNDGGKFVVLDPAKTYGVVANNYTRSGGDGYDVFRDKAIKAYDFGPSLEDTTAAFIAKNSPYKPYLDGRITVVAATTDAAKPAETAKQPEAAKTADSTTSGTAPAADVKTPELPAAATDISNTAPEVKTEPTANAEPQTQPAQTTESRHVIARGDTYWDLAKQFYGDATLWKKIAEANKA
uniref:5'-nucleotidase C-terminal domain-containing protein n=1 Tax=uncultured Rhizobium sp. TaxID=155567 RepID=UPI0026281809